MSRQPAAKDKTSRIRNLIVRRTEKEEEEGDKEEDEEDEEGEEEEDEEAEDEDEAWAASSHLNCPRG